MPLSSYQCSHVGVAGGGLVNIGLVDDEEDLEDMLAKITHAPHSSTVLALYSFNPPQLPGHSRSSVGAE